MKNNQAATIYAEVLAAMERKAKAPFDEIQPLLESLAGIGSIDWSDGFGLTISMRAAALGNLEVVEAAHALGASLELRNELTNANLLHYAAQQPKGGADIVKWVILHEKASDDLLNQQILVLREKREKDKDWDRGNGDTVAFEAVFNNNVGVVEALVEIENQGHKVDFTTPAVHGLSPLGWALTTRADKVRDLLGPKLRPHSKNIDAWTKEEDSATKEYAEREDNEWRSNHPQDVPALELAQQLREYIVNGPTQGQRVENLLDLAIKEDVDPNKPYGRFGQPLLILVPTHPDIMNRIKWDKVQIDRYTDVMRMLMDRKADPRTREKGLMEVSAGFREVFFGFLDALELMIQRVDRLDRAAFVNEVGRFNGYTRLIDAALIGRTEAIKRLLEHNPERRIRGFNGWTAYAAAEIYNNKGTGGKIPDQVLTRLALYGISSKKPQAIN